MSKLQVIVIIIGLADSLLGFENQCLTKRIVLGNETAKIDIAADHFLAECSWIIPTGVQGDHYAVVLWLGNIRLRYSSGGCAGKLRFPGHGFSCAQKPKDCWIYTKEENGCAITDIEETLPLTNLTCKSPLFWKNLGSPVKIEYHAGNALGFTEKFIINYSPVNCGPTPPPTTILPPITVGHSTTRNYGVTAPETSSPTMMILIIIIIISVSVGIPITATMATFIIKRFRKSTVGIDNSNTRKNNSNQTATGEINLCARSAVVDDGTYENSDSLREESGYELPRSITQYENLKNEALYEEIKDDADYET